MKVTDFTIERFEQLDVDADAFGHAAHVFVARQYLLHVPEPQALDRFRDTLRRLTSRLGVPGKYHETITCFYLSTIARRLAARHGASWERFCAANPDLFDGSALASRYTPQRLASNAARRRFLEPDRESHAAQGSGLEPTLRHDAATP